jgi:hypothetical protein
LALDRQSIEKRDFPFGRRGYEPAAVDAHLAALAREVEALKNAQTREPTAPAAAAPSPPPSLAAVASAQVQAIVEAAEASAAAIEHDARENAAQTAQDAAREAQRIRDEAIERSQDHVGKVHEATGQMLQRVDAMETELSTLIESLRTGANRLNADLSLLSGNMSELYDAAGQSAAGDFAAPAPLVDDVVIAEEAEIIAAVEDEITAVEDEMLLDDAAAIHEPPASVPPPEPALAPPPAAGTGDDDLEGARLIALNMALNGQSRAETDKYLAENFDLSDRAALLDEVYATVEG